MQVVQKLSESESVGIDMNFHDVDNIWKKN